LVLLLLLLLLLLAPGVIASACVESDVCNSLSTNLLFADDFDIILTDFRDVVGLKNRRAENCSFPTDSCKLPTEEITGAQTINSSFFKVYPKCGFSARTQILHFLCKTFPTK